MPLVRVFTLSKRGVEARNEDRCGIAGYLLNGAVVRIVYRAPGHHEVVVETACGNVIVPLSTLRILDNSDKDHATTDAMNQPLKLSRYYNDR